MLVPLWDLVITTEAQMWTSLWDDLGNVPFTFSSIQSFSLSFNKYFLSAAPLSLDIGSDHCH